MADIAPITCPDCKKKFKPKADVRGKRIRCPFCTGSFIVPIMDEENDDDEVPSTAIQAKGDRDAPIPLTEAATVAPGGAPPPDEEGDNPYGLTHLDIAARCPNCAHLMPSEEAVVCLNCGYNTLTREWGKTEKTIGISFGRHLVYLMPGLLCLALMLFCIMERLYYSIVWPFVVEGKTWGSWMDHESLRMWGTMISLSSIFALGRYCYIRFVVRPLPEEIKME
jgi:DNA-directed RNA polymerase subunit RPC12/RpoP